MNNWKKKLQETGREYFKNETPNLEFKNKLDFTIKTVPQSIQQQPKMKPLLLKLSSLVASLVLATTAGILIMNKTDPFFDPLDHGLAQVRDLAELNALIAQSQQDQERGGTGFDNMTSTTETGMPSANETEEPTTHSETNVQVDGVDEGDIVKTDGDRIYKINGNRLQVIDILSSGSMDLLLDIAMNSTNINDAYTYFSDLYLSTNYLVVLGQRYSYFSYSYESRINSGSNASPFDIYYRSVPQTIALFYNLDTLTLAHHLEINGSLISSRRIDNRLYLISNHYPYTDENADPRPVFRLDETVMLPDFNEIKYLENMPTDTFTIITTVFMDDTVTLDYDVYLGASSWGIIYVSKQAIYLASYQYFFNTILGTSDSYGLLLSYLFENDGTVTFGGAAKYKGYVHNQFSIDEYDGHLRMVTTEGWAGSGVINRLYIFKRETIDGKRRLAEVSRLESGIGKPGETVRSVRFNGTVATIVTYEQTDPLYTLDLSDPTNPTIEAGLEISGYSTYQHVWAPNLIIGIGYESEGNAVFGLKLTLFDISDLVHPDDVGAPLVLWSNEYGWQWSEALYNHKALLISHEFDMIGFAISSYRELANSYFYWQYVYFNNYYIFGIDPLSTNPITIKKMITHTQFVPQDNDPSNEYTIYYYAGIDRAITAGSYLFAISNLGVTSHDITNDYEQVADLELYIGETPAYIM